LQVNVGSNTGTSVVSLRGTVEAPTATAGSSNTVVANTAYVATELTSKADLASPTFTGVPRSTTAAADTNTTQIATTAFVVGQASSTTPAATGTAAVGTSLKYARADHVHVNPLPVSGTTGQVLTKVDGTSYNVQWSTIIPGDRYLTTSTTSNTVSNGNKTFTIGTGLSYTPTQNITISYNAANHMHGEVLTYNSGTGVMTVDINHNTGSGTYAAWVVNVGGVTPATSVAWGAITGTISAQLDLQGQLDLKLAVTTAASTYYPLVGNPSGFLTSAPVTSVAGRTGAITLSNTDISGLGTMATATAADYSTTAVANGLYYPLSGNPSSFLVAADITGKANLASPTFTGVPLSTTAAVDTNTTQIATTAYVIGNGYLKSATASSTYAPLASPALTGTPTAPTATVGTNTTQLATTAFVLANAGAGAVTSVAGRTGAIVLAVADVSGAAPLASPTFTGTVTIPAGASISGFATTASLASYALLASPALTGVPTAPTALSADSSTTIATTAFVKAQGYITSSPVTSVAGRTGAITLANTDISGLGTMATATAADYSTTTVANGLYYPLAGNPSGFLTSAPVSSVAGRTGAIVLANTDISGLGTMSTATAADYSTTTAANALYYPLSGNPSGFLTSAPVSSVAGRTGAITLAVADVSGAAPLASPSLTGTPLSTTAAVDTNTTQIATTAYVVAQAASATPLVNGTAAVGTSLRYARADHVHGTDTTRAPLASPTFTGTPAAPTATAGTNTTQIATTAFVSAAIPTNSVKAWVNFLGVGTVAINASNNVSSITDNAVGDYTVNFTTAISDANYTVLTSDYGRTGFATGLRTAASGWTGAPTTKTTTAARIAVGYYDGNLYDVYQVDVAILR
jgi:hypothetical protein